MKNGTNSIVIESFNTIATLPDNWDHNRRYQKYILNHISNINDIGLDIGCGTGELTYLLSKYCKKIIGIDVSINMIKEAINRNNKENIEYHNKSVEEVLLNEKDKYSVIVSIASLHHMDLKEIFKLSKDALKNNGTFIIVDIFKEKSILDYIYSLISLLINPIITKIKNRKVKISNDEKKIWQEHAKLDHFNTYKEIKEYAKEIFGKFIFRRHLFWRYSLIYNKN